MVTRFWGPSTIPRLLEIDMGVENFYYLMADHGAEVLALIQTIHRRELEAFRMLADGPWDSVILVENTSTYYISPEIYSLYNMPHQREFVDMVKSRGKPAILHSCGNLEEIMGAVSTVANAEFHARNVREKAILRHLITACTEIIRNAYESDEQANEQLDTAEESILEMEPMGKAP